MKSSEQAMVTTQAHIDHEGKIADMREKRDQQTNDILFLYLGNIMLICSIELYFDILKELRESRSHQDLMMDLQFILYFQIG